MIQNSSENGGQDPQVVCGPVEYPCSDCGRVYHGDVCPGCGFGEAELLDYEQASDW